MYEDQNEKFEKCLQALISRKDNKFNRRTLEFIYNDIIYSLAALINESNITPKKIIEHLPTLLYLLYGPLWDLYLDQINIRSYTDIGIVINAMLEYNILRNTNEDDINILLNENKNLLEDIRRFQIENKDKLRENKFNEQSRRIRSSSS